MKALILLILLLAVLSPVSAEEVENFTVELSLETEEDIYIDGEQRGEGVYSGGLSYPYIATGQALGLVSYGEFSQLEYRSETDREVLSMTHTSGPVFLPFTDDGIEPIEQSRGIIEERTFLDRINPGFGSHSPEEPLVKVSYSSDHLLDFTRPEIYPDGELELSHQGLDQGNILIGVDPS